MKKYTKLNQGGSRKSDEITETPDRAASSRVQGKKKLGRGSINSFALLQTEDNNEEEEEDDTSMKDSTEESVGGKTTVSEDPSLSKDKTKFGATEDSMGEKSEGSSATPIPSVLAKTAGTPGTVSFANTTGKNETGLNKLKPTAKEKTGDIINSVSQVLVEGGKEEDKRGDGRKTNLTDYYSKSKGKTKTGGKSAKPSTPSTTTSTSRTSSSYAAAAGKDPTIQDRELQGVTAVVTIIVKVIKGDDPRKKFTDKIIEGLNFLHETGEDKEVAILLINHEGGVTSNTKREKNQEEVRFPYVHNGN